jgi:hypothetical protein
MVCVGVPEEKFAWWLGAGKFREMACEWRLAAAKERSAAAAALSLAAICMRRF